jgi:hypothetical protein
MCHLARQNAKPRHPEGREATRRISPAFLGEPPRLSQRKPFARATLHHIRQHIRSAGGTPMRPSLSFFALPLIFCAGFALPAQESAPVPKIVIDAKKPTPPSTTALAMNFGSSCHATSDAKSPFYSGYKPASIADMVGAPVAEIRITSYGTGWKSRDDIRAAIVRVWSAQSEGAAPGPEWQEGVWPDIVGAIRFKDGKRSAFEESSGHVCFVDHSGASIWTRIQLHQ